MRKMSKVSVGLTIIIGLFLVSCQSNTDRRAQNLESFAQLYGYARWFHPSDEAQEIDWEKFAVLGVQKVENIKSTAALRDTLYRLFSPIVQGLQIYEARKPETFNPDILLSPDPDAKPVAWQHSGVYLNERSNVYRSMRSNKSDVDKENESASAIVFKRIVETSHLNGKEVKFSGYFRSNIDGTKLFIQPVVSSSNNNKHEILIESHDWKRYELTLAIPKEAVGIVYGFEMNGDVEVWADNFEFAVNNGGKWQLADSVNMGFELGITENSAKPIGDWKTYMTRHTFEVTNENPFSGKCCLKVYYTGKMFDHIPQFGEITNTSIGKDLVCAVPLTLLTNDSATYPRADTTSLTRLQSELANINLSGTFNPQVNLASVIIVWNVLQHFFPYFDVVDTDWNEVLGETLKSTLTNKRKKDFYMTLSEMIAQIEDGHGVVFGEEMYHLPIRTEFIENKIVITASNDSTLKRGDMIHKIDGKPVMEVLDETEKIVSGSPQLRRYRALNMLGSKLDPDEAINKYVSKFVYNNRESKLDLGGTQLMIERDGKEYNAIIKKSRHGGLFFNPIDERKYMSETIVEIDSGIYYINMSKCTENEFEQKKETLAKVKAVIYDQRNGAKLSFFRIVPYWIDKSVTSTWWYIPQTIYPDRKEVEFNKSNWAIQPKQPLFKSKSIIINEPSVVSAGETIMGIIDHYNLAITVGGPTAGCNGNTNYIKLPCGYNVLWTGMKVLKHDGSQLYLKGFVPDYPVNKTIQAIKEGRDEFLEKALEVARQE